ncbi:carboxypeptidase-like regulatory domain-containing protein [Aquimarina sp. ERC-38]|uniref:carboxypeptidase-like regulatory domain-containing protein n=1 Tax=Aquimarina sp. ERC-38 TaxID=2949996 RepID=UPI00224607CA|nr:carboxypeptidase-like regulatory domain-containing protein [Aquimarina sp. ERC-38]UZO80036.1 carboxypeptidase-like regulatory domain-containing protein [Aquimarina sp. ERC-38]
MKHPNLQIRYYKTFLYLIVVTCFSNIIAQENPANFTEFKGMIVDQLSNEAIISATISLIDSNISTVSNDEGEFSIKIPKGQENGELQITHLGYQEKTIALSNFNGQMLRIPLALTITELNTVAINPSNPEAIVRAAINNRGVNYQDKNTIMTAFYRETIKKRKTYVSLSEAVVDVYKNPYVSDKSDVIKLYKARKSTDYKKLDTLTLKLRGGPSSTLYIDVMKNPESLFSQNILTNYNFSFDQSTNIDDKVVYVINFKQKPNIDDLLYYGKLYIDAESLAMTKAVFSLKLDDRKKATELFVRKKPANAKVYPTVADYSINYREKDGKWYYGYGRIDLAFKVNWRKKLFNSTYKLNVEMAVTDWKQNSSNEIIRPKERLKNSVVISDEASGFSDPAFWGEYNIIEPEKSIESAIKKIEKQLNR